MKQINSGCILLMIAVFFSFSVYAKGNIATQEPIKVVVEMSEFKYSPNKLVFETGKLYRLILKNVGKVKHEVDSGALSHLAYTRKLVVNNKKGELLAEIKGSPAEVEIGVNAELEWWFVPIQTVENDEFVCLLEGHYEAGMHGKMTFK